MTKAQKVAGASVRELKAAALDALVKQELTRKQNLQSSKMTRLKALRMARDAAEPEVAPKVKRAAKG